MSIIRRIPIVIALLLVIAMAGMPGVARADFQDWLAAFTAEAEQAGISAATRQATLHELTPDDRVVALDRKQPEYTLDFTTYIEQRLTPERVMKGVGQWKAHAPLLAEVAARYKVEPAVIVAIWGMETNYGGYSGGYDVIRSLATLAYDGRRSDYFRKELLNALKILDRGDIARDAMLGSWAGAMGQGQFMPSSFLRYAEDFDQDGRADIWAGQADVFASIAHYLKQHGWRDDMVWGRPVALPADFDRRRDQVFDGHPPQGCRAMRVHSRLQSLGDWRQFGLRRTDGADLPARELDASLVMPDGAAGPAYLVYANYQAVLAYNCSNHYALAVGLLADRIKRAKQGG